MKAKVETILKNSKNLNLPKSDVCNRRESFCKRWNILDDNKDYNKIKIRTLTVISKMLNDVTKPSDFEFSFCYNIDFLEDYCNELSMILGFDNKPNSFDKFEFKDLYKNLVKLDLNEEKDYNSFLWFLEETLNYNFGNYLNKNDLIKKINDALMLSNAKVKILKNNNFYELYPTNVEMLDNHLVFDNINWLNGYPKAKEHFTKAVKLDIVEENYRTIVDELRLSFELLLKDVLNNQKPLEKQNSDLGNYLKDNNISKEIINMFIKLLDLYTLYNNHNAKHNDKIDKLEINYIIYLTGTFISLIVQIDNNKQIVS